MAQIFAATISPDGITAGQQVGDTNIAGGGYAAGSMQVVEGVDGVGTPQGWFYWDGVVSGSSVPVGSRLLAQSHANDGAASVSEIFYDQSTGSLKYKQSAGPAWEII